MKNTALLDWWRQANEILAAEIGYDDLILAGDAHNWFLAGLTPTEAALRFVENVESSLEERSYYDV